MYAAATGVHLAQARRAGEQGGGVAVRSHAEQRQVETRRERGAVAPAPKNALISAA